MPAALGFLFVGVFFALFLVFSLKFRSITSGLVSLARKRKEKEGRKEEGGIGGRILEVDASCLIS